jgi:hypothetical protein
MVYESEFYTTRRPYTRPSLSSYSVTPYYDPYYSSYGGYGNYYSGYYSPYYSKYYPKYSYYNYSPSLAPYRIFPTYSRVGAYLSRPSFKFSYDTDFTDLPYHYIKPFTSVPLTTITTSSRRVYRDLSPIRYVTPPPRIYRRDDVSPARVFTSPSRMVSIRVKPSVLSREFDRIDRKYRVSPIGFSATDNYLNTYASKFNDETRDIRASTQRLIKEIHEPVYRAPSVPRFVRASSLARDSSVSRWDRATSVPVYSRYESDYDKYASSALENEFYVNKVILRPTRQIRDHIQVLSNIYRDSNRSYSVGLVQARKDKQSSFSKIEETPAAV